MTEFIVDIQEPVFVLQVDGYTPPPVDMRVPTVSMTETGPGVGVRNVINPEEIMLLRAAAQEALNQ